MARTNRLRRSSPKREVYEDDDADSDFEGTAAANQEKLRQLIGDLIGRWHWIALGLVLGTLGGLYYLSKAPSVYSSTASILVKDRASTVISSKDQSDDMDLKSVEALNTVSARIQRPELFQKVALRPEVRQIPNLIPAPVNWIPAWAAGWLPDKQQPAAAPTDAGLARAISGWTIVSVRRNTRLVDITVNHRVPEAARQLADAIVREYQAESTQDRSEDRNTSIEILMKESDAARIRLQAAQNALANYQRAITTQKELEAKEITATELRRRYLPKHPKMVAANNDVKAFQDRFLSEFEASRNSPADAVYWKENQAELDRTASHPEARLQATRRLLLARSAVLGGEITSQTEMFNGLLTRVKESDINQQSTEGETRINSYAQLPLYASSPKKPVILAGASMAGLCFGGLIALILIRLDNKLHTVAQAEIETGLPVLAAIPDITEKAINEIARKKKLQPEKLPATLRRWDPRLVFREGFSSTTFAETFRVLRASVSLLGDERERRITLFSSALPGEGKTFVSGNFALAAAQQGKRVLLIDLDLRKPSVHKLFGLKRDSHSYGSTEVLTGQASFEDALITDCGEPNLHVMLAGKRAPNPGELLGATRVEEFLKYASNQYDLVVIDSAPLLPVPDTRILAPLVDNFCLVTRAEYVPKGAIRRVIELLNNDDILPSGIVFNGYIEKKRLIGQNYSYGNYRADRYGRAYRYGYGSYGTYGSDED